MEITYSQLKKKDVVDVSTGKNLGKISDLIIDGDSGKILKIVVPGKKGCVICAENLELDYACIVQIGDDTILYKKCKPKSDECDNPCCFKGDEFDE